MAVRFALHNFLTGAPIADAPAMKGSTWALTLDKADSVSVKINFRDPAIAGQSPASLTEPHKTVLAAITDDNVVLAWGIIDPQRSWDEDNLVMTTPASGAWSYWDRCIIGTSAARTTTLTNALGIANTALDVTVTNSSFATVGKRLMQQRLGWPGATMPFTFPADETVTGQTKTYPFINLKSIGSALTDLTQLNNGPDFDFTAAYTSDGISLAYPVRAGTNAAPQLGGYVGQIVANGPGSPVQGLGISDDFSDFAVAVWMTSQGQDARGNQITLASRLLNDTLRVAAGYPPEDYVDTSRSDVSVQATLDSYALENQIYSSKYQRSFDFTLNAHYQDGTTVTPRLGQYRPGDYFDLVFIDHVFLGDVVIPCRFMSISGDETGEQTKISAQVVTS